MHRRLLTRARAVNIRLMAPLLGVAVFLAVLFATLAPAQAASTSSNLNFQARLLTSSGAIVPDGNYNIDFKIYDQDSTTGSVGTCTSHCLWEETRKNSNSQGVQVINGYFSVNLGSVTSFPSTINWDQQLYLTMNIGGTTTGASPTWDGEMQNSGHSIALTALPYSFVAGQLALTSGANRGTLSFGSVTNNPAITLPNASGTVCLQSASACGFESTTGNDFIQNQTAAFQQANFRIQSPSSSSIVAAINGASGQTADLLDVNNSTTVFSIGNNGQTLFKPTSGHDSTTFFQIQTASGNFVTADTVDSQLLLQGNNSTATLGSELASGVSCSGTNWSGTGPWTHTTGSASALSCTPPNSVTSGVIYQIVFTVGSTTAGSVTPQIGGTSGFQVGANSTNETQVITTGSTTNLKFTPTSTFNGTINSISVKQLTISTAVLSVNNSDGTVGVEIRSGGSGDADTFIGRSSGSSLTSGFENTAVGNGSLFGVTSGNDNSAVGMQALGHTTTGAYNTGVGDYALSNNTTGSENTGIGDDALTNSTTGSNNTALGGFAGRANISGSNNTVLGYSSGYHDPSVTTFATPSNLQNATMIGYGAEAQANNVLVLGGAGANAVNVGIGTTLPTNLFSISPDIYDTGSASVTSGTAAVTGSGTSWNGAAQAGMLFIFADGTQYSILSVTDNTHLTLSSNASTTESSSAYRIHNQAFYVTSTGQTQVRTSTNSTTAFQVQNAAGSSLFTVDTTNSAININNSTFNATSSSSTGFQIQNTNNASAIAVDTTVYSSLISDASFEGTTIDANWAALGTAGAPARATDTTAYQGVAALKSAWGTTNGNGFKYNYTFANAIYSLSFKIRLTAGTNMTTATGLVAGFHDTSDHDCSLSPTVVSVPVTTTGGWVSYSCSSVTLASGAGYFYIKQNDSPGSARTVYIDNVDLEQISSAVNYRENGIQLNGAITGPVLIQPNVDRTTDFQIQNAAGTSNLFIADTVNGKIGIGLAPASTGSQLQLSADLAIGTRLNINTSSTTNGHIDKPITASAAGGWNVGDPVVMINDSGNYRGADTTTARDSRIYGVGLSTVTAGNSGAVAIFGNTTINVDINATINPGDQLVSSSTSGVAMVDNNATTGIIGYATASKSSGTGTTVGVFIRPYNGPTSPVFRPSSDSTTAFQVQNAASSKDVFDVDTTNGQVILGTSSSGGVNGTIVFDNTSGSGTATITLAGNPSSSYTYQLPTGSVSSNQCLSSGTVSGTTVPLTFSNCAVGTFLAKNSTDTSSANAGSGDLYSFTNSGSAGSGGVLKLDNGTNTGSALYVTASGNPASGSALLYAQNTNATPSGNLLDLRSGSTPASVFSVDSAGDLTASGTITNTLNSLAALQIQNSSNSNVLAVDTTDGYVINNGTTDLSGNLIQNPSFEAGGTTDASGWYTPSATQVITNSSANAHSGNNELQITGNSSTHAVTTKYFLVHPGDQIYTEAYVKNSAGATGDAGIYVEFSDKDKGNATFSNADTGLPGTSYVLKSITATVPSSKYYVRIVASVKATATTGTFYFDDFYLKRINEQAPLLLTNVSTTAFQVQNASSQTVLGVDTTNSKIFTTIPDGASAIGFLFNTPSYTTSGAKLLSIQNNGAEKFSIDKDGNVSQLGNENIGSGKQYQVNGTQISSANLSNDSNLAKLNGTGPQDFTGNNEFDGTVLNKVASTTAFQVQNASNAVFTVDTSNNRVILGTASNVTGAIQFQGSGGTGKLYLVGPTTPDTGNWTLTIPTITANANICTDNSICSGYASSSSLTSGLAGKLNKGSVDTSSAAVTAVQGDLYAFTNTSSTIASGVLKLDNGNNTGNTLYVTGTNNYNSGSAYIVVNNTNGTPSGNLIDLQSNAADELTVDASGNVFANGNINIASGKVYEINGTQISSSALSNDSNLAKLSATQTFTGANTFSNASNSFTGDGSNLTNLNATNVASGTLADGRLTSNVALLNRTGQSFTGDNTFAPTSNNAGTTIKQTSGTATSGSVLDVQTANGSSHFLQITNAAANEGAVTLQSIGATRDLTLDSGSGTIKLGSNATTLQKTATAFTIDLNNASDSTLTVTNSSTGVASISVEGDVGVGAGRVFKVGATSGASTNCTSGTFLQNQVVSGGITTGGSCVAAVTTVGSAGGSVANGASISGNNISLGYADTTNPGIVSIGTQTFGGDKTFNGNTSVSSGKTFTVSGGATSLTGNSGGSGTALYVATGATSNIGLNVQAAASQTANLLQLEDSTGANLIVNDSAGDAEHLGFIDTPFGGFGQYGNLLQYSEQFDQSGTWAQGNITSVTGNDASSNPAPDGNTTADKIVSSGSGTHTLTQTYTTTTNGNYNFSVWLKTNSSTQPVQLRIDSTGATPTTGTAASFTATTTWQRFNVTQNFTGTPSNIKAVIIITNNNATVVAWGGQLVQSTIPQVYVRTVTSTVAASDGLVNNGTAIFQNSANSTTAFQIQNSSGTSLLTVDTTNTAITLAAGVTIGSSAGSGSLTNNGSTVNTTLALGNFNYTGSGNSGSIGTAAATVDIYTSISIAQTQSPTQALTIPNPSASTTYGRMIYLSNIGTASFTIGGVRVPPGDTATLMWSNSNGAASWQFAGAGASSIENQNTNDQTADFRISGTGRANTSFISPLFDSITGGLSLGTSTATSITIGNTANSTGTLLRSQDSSTAFQVQDVASAVVLGAGTSLDSANFIPNSSFEAAISGWTATAGTSAQDTTAGNAYSGNNTYKMNTAGTSNQSGVYYSNTALTNGQQYSISVEVKSASGSFTTFEMGWRTSGGTFNNCNSSGGTINSAMVPASGTSVGTSGWTRFTCVLTPNATGGNVYFRLSAASTQQWYIDSVFVEATSSGSFKGFEEGTAQLAGTVQTAVVFRPTNDSTTDFQVQKSNGTNSLTVDTLNNIVVIGSNSSDPSTCTNGGIYYNSSANRFKGCENGTWITIDSFVTVANFTSGASSWTIPQNASVIETILIGGGGGGGGGGAKTGGAEKQGGGGGGGGAYATQLFAASDLGGSGASVFYSVGGAGTSGSGCSTNGCNGASGGSGGNSCLSSGSSCSSTIYVEAYGGGGGEGGGGASPGLAAGGGGGGTAAAGSVSSTATGGTGGNPAGGAAGTNVSGGSGAGGGSGQGGTTNVGGAGGAAEYGGGGGGGAGGGNSASGNGGSSLHGAGGGGAGASLNSGNSGGAAAAGGVSQSNTSGGGGAGGNNTCTGGGNGSSNTNSIKAGAGGGGGGAIGGGGNNVSCNGGNGGAAGGGAGGGGASSGTGGNGGTGGAGEIWIMAW